MMRFVGKSNGESNDVLNNDHCRKVQFKQSMLDLDQNIPIRTKHIEDHLAAIDADRFIWFFLWIHVVTRQREFSGRFHYP